jgi:hypothetical protein
VFAIPAQVVGETRRLECSDRSSAQRESWRECICCEKSVQVSSIDRNEWSEEVLGNRIKGKRKEAGRRVRRDSRVGEGWRGKKVMKEGQSLL